MHATKWFNMTHNSVVCTLALVRCNTCRVAVSHGGCECGCGSCGCQVLRCWGVRSPFCNTSVQRAIELHPFCKHLVGFYSKDVFTEDFRKFGFGI